MALDSNIALQFQGMKLNDPLEQFGKAMTLSNMGVQNQFMQQKMDEQTRLSALASNRQKAFAASGGDSNKFLSALGQMGDIEGAQAFQEYTLKQQKDKADIRSKGITDAKGLQELRVRTAQAIKAGGTVDHVMQGIRELQAIGDEEGVRFLTSGLEQNPNPSREHIAAYLDPVISSGLSAEQFSMPKFQDAGGQLVNVNPNTQFAPINKTQTPESIASNQVAREGHQVTMRGQNLVNARAKETETRLSTAQQRLDQQNEQAISGAKGSKALIAEMRQLVKDNPRGTATPLAGPARFAESMKGVFDPGAAAGPAIRFNQLRDTLLATVDGLRRDGRMSNQDRQRLENAVGSGMTTPANTIEALNTVEEIIDRMGGNQGQAVEPQNDYLARRKKLLGY